MDIKSLWQRKKKQEEIQSPSSDEARTGYGLFEFPPEWNREQQLGYIEMIRQQAAIAAATGASPLMNGYVRYNGYDINQPETLAPLLPPLIKALPIQLTRFNDGFILIFTCQCCGLQQKNEFELESGNKKGTLDAISEWINSITDAFPKCSSVCEVLEAIAK